MKNQKKTIKTMEEAQEYLSLRIPQISDIQSSGEGFLLRTRKLCALLGDPQENVRVVHIAGTSGKGSVVHVIASLLRACGQSVGMTTSPHLNDIRERIVIDGEIISEEDFIAGLNDIKEKSDTLSVKDQPTYFEILTVLAYYIFDQKNCDYAVIETGLGGLYDATNIVRRADKVCVISEIGKDHTAILGETHEEIALQKAGIIQHGNAVFSFVTNDEARSVIEKETKEKSAPHVHHITNEDYVRDSIILTTKGTSFSTRKLLFGQKDISLGLIGAHQVRNALLALQTASYVCDRDQLVCDNENIHNTLRNLHLPGRLDIRNVDDREIIFDGAHNPQKMRALVSSLQELYPDEKLNIIFAAKEKKDYAEMLKVLLPITEQLIVTQFGDSGQDYFSSSVESAILEKEAKKIGYKNVTNVDFVEESLDIVLTSELSSTSTSTKILITGSLHLVGRALKYIKEENFTNKLF